MRSKSVADILKEALKQGDFDGLCNAKFECGCLIDDLAPCGCLNVRECRAGRRVGIGDDWIVEEVRCCGPDTADCIQESST